jgi:hypothetical protein
MLIQSMSHTPVFSVRHITVTAFLHSETLDSTSALWLILNMELTNKKHENEKSMVQDRLCKGQSCLLGELKQEGRGPCSTWAGNLVHMVQHLSTNGWKMPRVLSLG